MTKYEEFIGNEIEEIFIDECNNHLKFKLGNGKLAFYYCDAGCCSESWIHHISGTQSLRGRNIIKVEETEEKRIDGTRQDEDQAFSIKLFTSAGVCDLEFRNSSNGFYGGNFYLDNLPRPDCVYKKVEEDF